jgi:hypothetical protein
MGKARRSLVNRQPSQCRNLNGASGHRDLYKYLDVNDKPSQLVDFGKPVAATVKVALETKVAFHVSSGAVFGQVAACNSPIVRTPNSSAAWCWRHGSPRLLRETAASRESAAEAEAVGNIANCDVTCKTKNVGKMMTSQKRICKSKSKPLEAKPSRRPGLPKPRAALQSPRPSAKPNLQSSPKARFKGRAKPQAVKPSRRPGLPKPQVRCAFTSEKKKPAKKKPAKAPTARGVGPTSRQTPTAMKSCRRWQTFA